MFHNSIKLRPIWIFGFQDDFVLKFNIFHFAEILVFPPFSIMIYPFINLQTRKNV